MKERITNLREQIEQHNIEYYSGKPTISDAAFDAMFNKLVELEAQYPEFHDPNSPTQRVGSEAISEQKKGKHISPALSIKNAAIEQIQDFLNRYGELIAETKYDGIAISLIYKNGQLHQATTRGNGTIGTIVTENVRTIRNLPLKISEKRTIEIRGEVVFPEDILNQTEYPNCQAAAAALILGKVSKNAAKYPLQFIAHGLGNSSEYITLDLYGLRNLGFQIPRYTTVTLPGQVLLAKEELLVHKNLPVDGVVFKIDNPQKRKQLGNNNRYFNWALAWKPAIQHTAKIVGVNWNVTQKGNISPVACFQEPITINGTNVIKAALHNFDNILNLKIGEGATAHITFTGNVPNITHTTGTANIQPKPAHCPSCGKPVTQIGKFIRCDNAKHCLAQGGIPDTAEKYKYYHTQRHFINWTSDHAAIVANKLGMKVHRTKKGSPYIALKFNALGQLAKFAYCMAAEQLPAN